MMYFALLIPPPPLKHIFGEEKLCRYCWTFMFFNPWKTLFDERLLQTLDFYAPSIAIPIIIVTKMTIGGTLT